MTELAGGAEAAALHPLTADGLVAHRSLTVSERAVVSFSAGRVIVEVAVVSVVGHGQAGRRASFQADEFLSLPSCGGQLSSGQQESPGRGQEAGSLRLQTGCLLGATVS